MNLDEALSKLSRQIGYTFENDSLLTEALTHRSMGSHNNERLEFLGDSILNFVIAETLFCMHPKMQEGDLSRLRASLVNGEMLAEVARELNLGDYLKLGAGELKSGGFRRSSILADTLESILGAVYCDSNFDTCRDFILKLFDNKLKNLPDADKLKDPKTRLQELLQSRHHSLPDYEVFDVKGQSHAQTFYVECKINEFACVTKGEGSSRRKAEQAAAEQALAQLQKQFSVQNK
jgi:ribonuclease-3